jgi:hypothetical protein
VRGVYLVLECLVCSWLKLCLFSVLLYCVSCHASVLLIANMSVSTCWRFEVKILLCLTSISLTMFFQIVMTL